MKWGKSPVVNPAYRWPDPGVDRMLISLMPYVGWNSGRGAHSATSGTCKALPVESDR